MPRARPALFAILALALPLLLAVSPDFGVTWDEPQQRQKAHHLLDYWQGLSPAIEVPDDGAHLYGAPIDVVAAWLEPRLPLDPYVIRHGAIACVAWLGLLFTGLLARRLFGECLRGAVGRAPRRESAIHRARDEQSQGPPVRCRRCRVAPRVGQVASQRASSPADILGVGLNVRAGALLFYGYLGVLVAYRAVTARQPLRDVVLSTGPRLLAVLAGGVAIGWVAWPWAYEQPLIAPFRGLALLSRFPWGGQVLFDGATYAGLTVPDSYVPTWLWMSLPPVVLAGAAASLLLLRTACQAATVALWSAVVFLILYVMGTSATLYDGIRHLLFVVPPVAILASAGLVHLLRTTPPRVRWLSAAALAAALLEPALFQAKNHPNQAAYVQPLAGGPRHAVARFDLDYWGNCLLGALKKVPTTPGATTFVTGWPLIVLQANGPRVPGVTVVADDDPRAQYDVRLVRGGAGMR